MKSGIIQFAGTLLLLTFFISVFPTEEDYRVYDDTLRLHILANSDSREDQDLKIGVRDLVLDKFGGRLSEAEAIDSALLITEDMLTEIEGVVEEHLLTAGCDFGATVSLSKEWYETRDYGEFTLPRGYYSSLVITLGQGKGQN
jgi:stage II sporulation protein R